MQVELFSGIFLTPYRKHSIPMLHIFKIISEREKCWNYNRSDPILQQQESCKMFSDISLLKTKVLCKVESCNVPGSQDTDLEYSLLSRPNAAQSWSLASNASDWVGGLSLQSLSGKDPERGGGGAHSFPKTCGGSCSIPWSLAISPGGRNKHRIPGPGVH